MRRASLVLLLALLPVTSSCETVQEIAGVCVAIPVAAICGAGFVVGACSRCTEGPAPDGYDDAAAAAVVEVPVTFAGAPAAMGY